VVLAGDSILQGFNDTGRSAFERVLLPLHAEIRNVADVNRSGPKAVVLSLGSDDLTAGVAPDAVVAATRAIIDRLRTTLPHAQLLLLGVLARGERYDDPLRARVAAVNRGVEALADGDHVHFLDVARAPLRADGNGDATRFAADFVHLQAAGYAAWADLLERTVRERLDAALLENAALVV